jgi:hypothetical protein
MPYVGIEKHKLPWQRGRRGSLCPRSVSAEQAQELFDGSILVGKKRFAYRDGTCFAAQLTRPETDEWHGYPVKWGEVPPEAKKAWREAGLARANGKPIRT